MVNGRRSATCWLCRAAAKMISLAAVTSSSSCVYTICAEWRNLEGVTTCQPQNIWVWCTPKIKPWHKHGPNDRSKQGYYWQSWSQTRRMPKNIIFIGLLSNVYGMFLGFSRCVGKSNQYSMLKPCRDLPLMNAIIILFSRYIELIIFEPMLSQEQVQVQQKRNL